MSIGRLIQSTIIFSAALGAVFLYVVYGSVPSFLFEFLFVGWALFVLDSALTFVRREASFYLGAVLAVLALGSSLPQSAHYEFIESGQVVPSVIFVAGSLAQVLILISFSYWALGKRKVTRQSKTRLDVSPADQHVAVMGPSLPDVATVEHVRDHHVPDVLVGFVDGVRHRRP